MRTGRLFDSLHAGKGRLLALLFAAVLALLLALPGDGPLPSVRLDLFDTYQSLMPRQRVSAPVHIVAIDEAAIKEFGQWPWPRTRLAKLIDIIAADGALAIGLDLIMPEADNTSPEALAASLPEGAARSALATLPPNDAVLIESMRRAPVVLGVAGFPRPAPGTTSTIFAWPMLVRGGDAGKFVMNFPQVLASLPAMGSAAHGQALLSAELENGIVRRVPMLGAVNDTLVPALSMELLRVATQADAIRVTARSDGVRSVSVGDLVVPTEANGSVWPHFSRLAPDRYISAYDILTGKVPPETLESKIVIIATTGLGLMDFKTNVLGEHLPGVDVHAQLIESFFDGRMLHRPNTMRLYEATLFFAFSLLLIWAMPRLKLRMAALLVAGFSLALFGGGAMLFLYRGLLFDAAGVFIATALVGLTLLVRMFVAEARARVQSQVALQEVREQAARTAGELDAARRIQMASVPQAASAFPGETRFALDALLEPARHVGGDLYDFFMLDKDHLFFLIGDVSGKGLPASLFMVVAKALSKSIALRGTGDVADIVRQANLELLRENPEMLFVTGLAGILDARNGKVSLCNAGHDAPRRIRRDGQVEALRGADGPPLCVIEGFAYPVHEYLLKAGEGLCLSTDGISEAMNEAGQHYGSARLDAVLARTAANMPAEMVRAVREDVRQYVGTAEPSDDMALLVLRWNGA